MSTATHAVAESHIPAAAALRQADDSVAGWLKGLVTGSGDSPSQIIVTGVLGVVPGVGQAMDARDLIVGVIALSASPTSPMTWLEMLMTLIGCVPLFGDSLKVGFKLMVKGHSLARVLDGVSPKLRGNVEAWMKNVDWAEIARVSRKTFDDTMNAFVNALDGWVLKTVLGRQEARHLIAQLEDLRKRAPKMLDDAIVELQKVYRKAIGEPLPVSTARVRGTTQAAKQEATAETKTQAKQAATLKYDRSGQNPAGTQRRNAKTKREEEAKRQPWKTGVPAEHLTDYHTAKTRRNLKKANNAGRLWEEWDRAGRQGIDHVWVNKGEPLKPGVIGETKSSLFGAFRFMAALPADIRAQLSELGDAEAANPTASSNQPNIFHSEGRDGLDQRAKVDGTKENEAAIKRGVGNTKNKGVQMSHKWITRSIQEEDLTAAGKELQKMITRYRKQYASGLDVKPPYARWIIMVTGRQKHLHEKAQGHQHEIQKPLIVLPDNILSE
jgi:hypothetical protein